MSKKITFTGLPWWTTDAELHKLCVPHGSIDKLTVQADPTSGKSLGVAHVTFTTSTSAETARSSIDPPTAFPETPSVTISLAPTTPAPEENQPQQQQLQQSHAKAPTLSKPHQNVSMSIPQSSFPPGMPPFPPPPMYGLPPGLPPPPGFPPGFPPGLLPPPHPGLPFPPMIPGFNPQAAKMTQTKSKEATVAVGKENGVEVESGRSGKESPAEQDTHKLKRATNMQDDAQEKRGKGKTDHRRRRDDSSDMRNSQMQRVGKAEREDERNGRRDPDDKMLEKDSHKVRGADGYENGEARNRDGNRDGSRDRSRDRSRDWNVKSRDRSHRRDAGVREERHGAREASFERNRDHYEGRHRERSRSRGTSRDRDGYGDRRGSRRRDPSQDRYEDGRKRRHHDLPEDRYGKWTSERDRRSSRDAPSELGDVWDRIGKRSDSRERISDMELGTRKRRLQGDESLDFRSGDREERSLYSKRRRRRRNDEDEVGYRAQTRNERLSPLQEEPKEDRRQDRFRGEARRPLRRRNGTSKKHAKRRSRDDKLGRDIEE